MVDNLVGNMVRFEPYCLESTRSITFIRRDPALTLSASETPQLTDRPGGATGTLTPLRDASRDLSRSAGRSTRDIRL
jgi:hypothetical protein